MMRTLIFFDALPSSKIDADALLRVIDQGEKNVIAPANGFFIAECVVCATTYVDVGKCAEWLREIDKNRYIKRVAVVVNSSQISAEDVSVVVRAFFPHTQIEFADGRVLPMITSREQSADPFEDGVIASLDEIEPSANPYLLGSEQHAMWADGHQTAGP